ncbi:arginine/lysine/ornithine decarboxylase [Oikeobacillus pervagus]|uniref:Arginine/lysine/ornithine decarboxylase n=1 Tax=Oikeobacillus pervagus TaxID=1325931 RepID=A0AAJ1T415_9BACI|nr:aminotransferase class I/II-fold pyridoxal phosphate-dependent enzyme [Oikeobacillus pervagus]MDQ0216221.1 arginine/lysine/ornithine decarboxylase [Oikeobacillus pervagus]
MDQRKTPIIDVLNHFVEQQNVSFHVPGHKNGQIISSQFPPDFSHFLQFDVTELTGLDDFHSPSGMIAEGQRLLTDLYQTRKSYFLVNGSTVGNLAMILSVCEEGDTVFVQRNCHKSILHALMIAKVEPVFLEPEYDAKLRVANGVALSTIKLALRKFPQVKAVVLTYPNYYGLTYELQEIIKLIHDRGGYVLVDEAHGPHFIIGKPFPESSLLKGADIVIQSAHKMLPAMTMGSFLHVNGGKVSIERLEFYLHALQSSSPSYPIMASLDLARSYVASFNKEDIDYTLKQREDFIDLLQKKELEVITADPLTDPLKLVVRNNTISGYGLQKQLEDYGVYTELADPYQVLFVLPLLKKGMDHFYEKAVKKLVDFRCQRGNQTTNLVDSIEGNLKVSKLAISYKDMKDRKERWIPLDKAVGEVSSKMVIPYPPGIPLFMQGEEITKEQVVVLQVLKRNGAHIQGDHRLEDNQVAVFC